MVRSTLTKLCRYLVAPPSYFLNLNCPAQARGRLIRGSAYTRVGLYASTDGSENETWHRMRREPLRRNFDWSSLKEKRPSAPLKVPSMKQLFGLKVTSLFKQTWCSDPSSAIRLSEKWVNASGGSFVRLPSQIRTSFGCGES